jgi:hypothetical protein
VSPFQLEPIRQDLEVSLSGPKACRQLLVVIPTSLEAHRVSSTCSAMARRCFACGAFMKRSVMRSDTTKLEQIDSLDPYGPSAHLGIASNVA